MNNVLLDIESFQSTSTQLHAIKLTKLTELSKAGVTEDLIVEPHVVSGIEGLHKF